MPVVARPGLARRSFGHPGPGILRRFSQPLRMPASVAIRTASGSLSSDPGPIVEQLGRRAL
jgi:hypothetical protein